jgi:tetratricopeptide (TPR) repeat protein
VAGIPLAIELAAARLSTISPTDLAERMGHQLDLLTAGTRTADRRQQTLEAALDWSYRLLSDREQAVLRRAAVFRGSFTLAAAEAVLAGRSVDSEHVADLLGRLADASMITMGHQQANRRYGMLEPIRQYGLKLLAKTGETAETRQAHVRYFAERSAELTEQFEAQKWSQLLTTGEPIIDDCRDSLSWAIDAGDSHRALGLAASIGSYWTVAGATREGLSVLANALETTPVVPSSERLRTLEHCAHFAIGVGEPADRWLDELEKVVAQGATEYSARAAGARGLLAYARGDLNQAMGLFANAYHASLEAEHEPVRTGTLLAECLTRVGRLDEADALLDELDRGEAQQDEYGNHYIAVARGMVAFCRGSLEVAEAHLETAVKAFGIQGSAAGQMESMMYLGWVALDLGKVRRTRLLVENSLALARKYAGALYEATSLWLLARLALQQGDTDGARVTLEVCTDVAVRRREAVSVAFALFVWADLAYLRNHPPRAAQLFGAAERALHGLPHIMPPTIGRGYAEATADLRDKMGTARFEHLTGVGHEMTRDDAIAYATSG